jgi:hypothetical protein
MSIEEPLSSKDPVKEIGYKAFRNLVSAGQISASWVGYREVYLVYLKHKSQCERSAIMETSYELDKPYTTIHYIVNLFK